MSWSSNELPRHCSTVCWWHEIHANSVRNLSSFRVRWGALEPKVPKVLLPTTWHDEQVTPSCTFQLRAFGLFESKFGAFGAWQDTQPWNEKLSDCFLKASEWVALACNDCCHSEWISLWHDLQESTPETPSWYLTLTKEGSKSTLSGILGIGIFPSGVFFLLHPTNAIMARHKPKLNINRLYRLIFVLIYTSTGDSRWLLDLCQLPYWSSLILIIINSQLVNQY